MIITGPDTTSIKENPGAGNSFGISHTLWREYLLNYRDLFYEAGIMVDISPPVLNADNTVVYDFPNPGSDDTNGKQTAGLWVAPTGTPGDFITDVAVFDQKESFDTVVQIATRTPYYVSDGSAAKVGALLTHSGSFVANSTAPFDEYTISETSTAKALQVGTSVEDPTKYPFNLGAGRSDLQLLSYDLQWGSDNAANYGPFNFSNGDLQTMGTYIGEAAAPTMNGTFSSFSYVNSSTNVRGPTKSSSSVVNPDEDSLEPVLMEITSSLTSRFDVGSNMHVSYTKTLTKFGGR